MYVYTELELSSNCTRRHMLFDTVYFLHVRFGNKFAFPLLYKNFFLPETMKIS